MYSLCRSKFFQVIIIHFTTNYLTHHLTKTYQNYLLKPLYIKLHDTLEELSFKISIIKPTETISKTPHWNTNRAEVNKDLNQCNKKNNPHYLIIGTFHEIINNKFIDYHQIYTNASKTTNGTGFTITSTHTENSTLYKLASFTSIFKAKTLLRTHQSFVAMLRL